MTLAQGRERPAGWDDATHERRVAPDYERLFATDRVHELQIAIDAADFRAMQEDLRTIGPPGMPPGFGGRLGGAGPQGPPPGIGGPPGLPGGFGPPAGGPAADGFAQMAALMEAGAAACQDKPAEAACSANGMDGRCTAMFGGPLTCVPEAFGDVMRGGGAPSLTSRDPMYVPVTVRHEGRVWTHVGMRYKGNSSLMMSNMSGSGKVPFRLH